MNGGYDDFRRRNDESNRRNEERNRQQALEHRQRIERDRDRSDAERRHREQLKAASPGYSYRGGREAPSLSWKALIILFVIGLGGIIAASFLPDASASSREHRLDEGSPDEGITTMEPLQDTSPTNDEGALENIDAETPSADEKAPVEPDDASQETSTLVAGDRNLEMAATMQALMSGNPAGWETAEGRHFVAVSTPVQVGARTCRTVAVNGPEDESGEPKQRTWCMLGDEKWSPSQ